MATKKETADTAAKQEQAKETPAAAVPTPAKKSTARKRKLDTSGLDTAMNTAPDRGEQAAEHIIEQPKKETGKEQPAPKTKPFKKPNSDYYRLDLIAREIVNGKMTADIKTNYKEYLEIMAAVEGVSITRYIQGLLDTDMSKRKQLYKAQKELREQAKK
jgi:hypothetical protein